MLKGWTVLYFSEDNAQMKQKDRILRNSLQIISIVPGSNPLKVQCQHVILVPAH